MDKEFMLLAFMVLAWIILIVSCFHINENFGKKIKKVDTVDTNVINLNVNKNITYEDNPFTSKILYNLAIDRVDIDYRDDLKTAVEEYKRIDDDLLRIGRQLKTATSANTKYFS